MIVSDSGLSGRAQDIRPASTVVLLRDGAAGPEVFLMRRHGASGFMAGATVFPGGKLDTDDRMAPASGRDGAACAHALDLADPELARAFFVAAIRELHEESHVLLACDAALDLPDARRVAAIDAEQDGLRMGHRLACRDWHDTVRAAGLQPALDRLQPFAHWLTPSAEPRRFDTYFFAAVCPPHQVAALDRHESTHAFWMTPAHALAQHESGGELLLPPPTLHTIGRLAAMPAATAAAWVARLAQEGVGPCIEPWFQADSPEGPAIVMPEDPLHPDGAAWRAEHRVPARIHRFVLLNGRFTHRLG